MSNVRSTPVARQATHNVPVQDVCAELHLFGQYPPNRRLPGAHSLLVQWGCHGPRHNNRRSTPFTSGTVAEGAALDDIVSAMVAQTGHIFDPTKVANKLSNRRKQQMLVVAAEVMAALTKSGLIPVDTQVPFPAPRVGVCPVSDIVCVDAQGGPHLVELKLGAVGMVKRGGWRSVYMHQLAIQAYCAEQAGLGNMTASRCHLLCVATTKGVDVPTVVMATLTPQVLLKVRTRLSKLHLQDNRD